MMISAFKKSTFIKQKSLRLQKKSLISRKGVMVGSVLHYILGCIECELHICTMRLYCKHNYIYRKLTGSHIRAFVFFIVMLKLFVLVIVKIW